MDWQGRRQSDNVEDRQSQGGGAGGTPFGRGGGFSLPIGRRGGGLSIGTIIFLVVIYLIFKAMGIDLMQVMDGGSLDGAGYEQSDKQNGGGAVSSSNDQMTAFVKTVLAETEDTWQGIFQSQGRTCPSSNDLRLFGLWKSGFSGSVCGLS